MKDNGFFNMYRKNIIYLINATTIYFVVLILKETKFLSILGFLFDLFLPLIIGFIIAWLLNPLVDYIERKGYKRIYGTTVIFIVLLVIIALIFKMLIPVIITQLRDLILQLNDFYLKFDIKNYDLPFGNELQRYFTQQEINNYLSKIIQNLFSNLNNTIQGMVKFISNIIGLIADLFLILTIAFCFMIDFHNLKGRFLNLFPKHKRDNINSLLIELDEELMGYVKGILLVSVFLTFIATIAFWLLGLKGSVVFAIFMGITDVIPYFGPVIGGIPAVLAASIQGFDYAVLTLITIFVCQFIESSILQPFVIGKATELNPVLILMGLFIGGKLFGIFGLLISTPIIIFILVILRYLQQKKL